MSQDTTPAESTFDEGVLLGEFDKSSREKLRIHRKTYRGREFVDIRTWYATTGGELRATAKGITVRPQCLGELIKVLERAQEMPPT